MIAPVKYFLSLPMKRQIIDVGEITRHSRHIAVIFPMKEVDLPSYKTNFTKLIRNEFVGCKLYAVVSDGNELEDFDTTVSINPNIATFSRRFFRTKESLRNLHIDISFDLNETIDLITYLIGASLRVGTIDSAFYNVVIKGAKGDPVKMFSIFSSYPS